MKRSSKTTSDDKAGFSLVELSIVLVILGLLVGGVLSGQSLIRAAELRSFSTTQQKFSAAMYAFRDKYFAIPGDMTNATQFWGDNNSVCPDAAIANGNPGTCNGDGDGRMAQVAFATGATSENMQMWNQLALAGLIEGSYAGLYNTTATPFLRGVTVPAGKLRSDTYWIGAYAVVGAGDPQYYAMDYGNYIREQGDSNNSTLKPEEAWNIDTKFDDGKPAYGKIIAWGWNNTCAAPDSGALANTNLNASYRLSDSSVNCMLNFRQQI